MRYALFTTKPSGMALAAMLIVIGGLLAGCQTDGAATDPLSELAAYNSKKDETKTAAKPPAPPMTRSQAASECWMKTEKGMAGVNLDKRADTVNKCIEDKMKGGDAPKS